MPIAEAASVPRPYMLVPINWRPTDSVRKATNVHGLAAIAFTASTARKPKRMPEVTASAATSSTTRTCRCPALDLGAAAGLGVLWVSRAGATATGAGGSTTVSGAVPETRLRPSAFDR